VTVVDPADTALLVTRALRHASTVLAALAVGAAAARGAAVEAAAVARGVPVAEAHAAGLSATAVALVIGLVAVLAVHVAVRRRARRGLDDRLAREWAAVESDWRHRHEG
jgi:hypothetical protein